MANTKFDAEGKGYDYSSAVKAGLRSDKTGHWPSVAPRTGLILKGRKHKTWDLTTQEEDRLGYKVIKKPDGRYYSVPIKGK